MIAHFLGRAWVRPAIAFAFAIVALIFLTPEGLVAQAGATAEARQMRQFWHVFAAYAIAWVLIFGWLLSILRRIKNVEKRLQP